MGLFSKCKYSESKCPQTSQPDWALLQRAEAKVKSGLLLQQSLVDLLDAAQARERRFKSTNALKNEEIAVLTLRLQEVTAHRDALLIDLDKYVQALLKRKRK